jgi:beta-lactamase regulating signal transducer with metallopeptidase domain
MIAWMIYCVIAGALLSVAARAGEWIARIVGVPVRWCWTLAMLTLAVLAAVAPLRQSKIRELPVIDGVAALPTERIPLQAGIVAISRQLPSFSMLFAAVAWIVASAVLLFIIFAVHARMRRARHSWPLAEMHGARVRVAPEIGPVVIGFRVPEIVVPRWLLARSLEEQRLIVTHEAEHVRAKDTMLLGAGVVTAALMPWNPFVWYMFSRLRLAVELDCDARVLRRGTTIESYGSLLIEVAASASPFRLGVAAFTNSSSHLHERIIAMKQIVPKYARLRASLVGVVGAAALLVACEAKMPTSAEVDQMDVSKAERRLAFVLPSGDSISAYLVDRKQVTREQALSLRSDSIRSMELVRVKGEPTKLLIATMAAAPAGEASPVRRARGGSLTDVIETSAKTSPLIMIDGVRSSMDALRALDRTLIESVEVLKGRAVREENPGFTAEELAAGLIKVTTKRGGPSK